MSDFIVHVYIYRLTKLILNSLSVIKMSLDVQLSWSGQEMVHHSSSPVRWISSELKNLQTIFVCATSLKLLVSLCIQSCMYVQTCHVCVFTYCINTNTVLDTPSGSTPSVQDITASPAEHIKQGKPVYYTQLYASLQEVKHIKKFLKKLNKMQG